MLESSDPNVARGVLVEDGATINVAPGAVLTVVGEDGVVFRLEGPYRGPIAAPGVVDTGGLVAALAALAVLFGESGVDTGTLGAVRGGVEDEEAGLWTIDLARPGHRCVDSASGPFLRGNGLGGGRLRSLVNGTEAELAWDTSDSLARWPAALALVDGGAYEFVPDATSSLVRVVVHVVPSVMPSAAHVAGWLAEQGCELQARVLLDQLVAPSGVLSLELATTRGLDPVFRVGEVLDLRIAPNRDAFVHCVYLQAEGTVLALFPNRFTGGPRMAGLVTHAVPRPGDGLNLVLSGPPGRERVDCFAWTKDPSGRLPTELAAADITHPIGLSFSEVLAKFDLASPDAHATVAFELRE
ncbi:MAG: DUF4384 domain-containing protein [Alphaproteobacteria bacterium]